MNILVQQVESVEMLSKELKMDTETKTSGNQNKHNMTNSLRRLDNKKLINQKKR